MIDKIIESSLVKKILDKIFDAISKERNGLDYSDFNSLFLE